MKREKILRLPSVYNAGGDTSKRWFVEFYCKDPRTGKLERQKVYTGINKHQDPVTRQEIADQLCKKYTEKLKNGWSPFMDDLNVYEDNLQFQTHIKNYRKAKSKNGTFAYYSSLYLDSIKDSVDPEGTLPTYRSKLRMFNAWLESRNQVDIDITSIDQPLLFDFFTFIIREQELSATSIKKYRQILSACFEYVKKDKKMFVNPCFDLPTTKRINDQTPQPVQEFDIQPFKEMILAKDPQLWLAICFEYYCFMRPGKEIRLLKVGEIDYGRGMVRVNPVNSKTTERQVPVPIQFLKIIREQYKIHTFNRSFYVFGKNGIPGPEHLSKNCLRTRFRKIRESLSMPEMYKLYSWKHTGNVCADNSDIPLREIQNQNGHSSMKMTENYLKNKRGNKSKNIVERFPTL